jgi:hypothetical protein
MTETGRHQEDSSLLLNTRGWRILARDGDIWGRIARAVAALKNSRKETITIQKCHCTDVVHM